jgi:hypothetical protein
MSAAALTLAVVGVDYPNRRGPTRRFAIQTCTPGDPVQLEPEPKNAADPRAVMVLNVRGEQMGYLTAERCGWIGSMLGEGRQIRAVFQEATEYGALIRAAFDGETPTLPVAKPRTRPIRKDDMDQTPEQDFWPDELPPEE